MAIVVVERARAGSSRKPSSVPDDQTGWKCGNHFGFASADSRWKFIKHFSGSDGRYFETSENKGLYWCVWSRGSNEPSENAPTMLGHTIRQYEAGKYRPDRRGNRSNHDYRVG